MICTRINWRIRKEEQNYNGDNKINAGESSFENLLAEAVSTTVYLLNRCPTKIVEGKTLFKLGVDKSHRQSILEFFSASATLTFHRRKEAS